MWQKSSRITTLILMMMCVSIMVAQGVRRKQSVMRQALPDSSVVVAYMDSLLTYKVRLDSLSEVMISGVSVPVANADAFRLFSPVVYYGSAPSTVIRGGSGCSSYSAEMIDRAMVGVYLKHPYLVTSTEQELKKAGALHEEIKKPIRHRVEYVESEREKIHESPDIPLDIVVNKPNFWTFGGDYYLQFLQNYVSGNWYKGGESNYSMVASATLQANYNNKQKVKFENKLELKLGFQTSRSDSLHNFKTSEDLIRYTGKLGLQAAKNWYYTLQLVAYTQFTKGYKSNDPMVYSDIMSPLNLNLSLGMSYAVSAFHDKLKGSLQMAPLALNFRYVRRKELATRYGLDEGKHTMYDFGSECTVDLQWQVSELIKWKTRLYGFTSYERAEVEWENTISFQFNKYISSNIFIYPRFDDAASNKDSSHGYFQLKEYASIGFSYSF
ncbi:MAG: DUF3078 domain-containing protein [Prevotella sp.]